MGWKINVLDACDKEPPSAEPSQSTSEDLQSRGSIQYTTRVKPDIENNQFYSHNEPVRSYNDLHGSPNKDYHHHVPSIPVAMEENLRNDFYKSQAHLDKHVYNTNPRFPPSSMSQQNGTLYAYPNSNYTYGNVPFYMPNVHYGSPQPVRSPTAGYSNYAMLPLYNTNYRPVRQPTFSNFQAQPNAFPDQYHHPVQMVLSPKQQQHAVAVKHGYRVSGKRLPPNGAGPMPNGAHHSVVYKKPVHKFNGQPVVMQQLPVASNLHYSPAVVSPVSQPVLPAVYPNHFQHQQQQQPIFQQHSFVQPQQQYQPLFQQQPLAPLQQTSTSMSKSVSVSYSSSKNQQPPQQTGYAVPIQNRQETAGQYYQGGFNPDTVVVESGFKPIIPTAAGGNSFPIDRSDQETGETTADLDEPATVRYHEKKMSKKLVSRKLSAKLLTNNATKQDTTESLSGTKAMVTTTENVDHENRAIAENTTVDSKQTAEILV